VERLAPKGQEEKPSLVVVGQEEQYYSVPNGQEEKTEGHMREARSETYSLYSCEYRAPVAWIGSLGLLGLPLDGTYGWYSAALQSPLERLEH
jgi:hypothetical protein